MLLISSASPFLLLCALPFSISPLLDVRFNDLPLAVLFATSSKVESTFTSEEEVSRVTSSPTSACSDLGFLPLLDLFSVGSTLGVSTLASVITSMSLLLSEVSWVTISSNSVLSDFRFNDLPLLALLSVCSSLEVASTSLNGSTISLITPSSECF